MPVLRVYITVNTHVDFQQEDIEESHLDDLLAQAESEVRQQLRTGRQTDGLWGTQEAHEARIWIERHEYLED